MCVLFLLLLLPLTFLINLNTKTHTHTCRHNNAAKHATIVRLKKFAISCILCRLPLPSLLSPLTLFDFCCVCMMRFSHTFLSISLFVCASLQLPEEKSPQHPVELSTELMLACTEALSSSYVKKNTHPKVPERLPDMIK